MKRIGTVTIGQSPRVDIVPELLEMLGSDAEIVEKGALDGLSAEQVAAMAPTEQTEVLVTRLADGSSVTISDEAVIPRVADAR
ncbi:AroM family protein [Brevibacillus massiliensis]|uniref:AroM family protein n=1 Tax=Brevibacillus massiliensis TaxID=1118054 RepID=UPI0002F211B9|nr:AroM family protein [Brevibacillus massiliensis]